MRTILSKHSRGVIKTSGGEFQRAVEGVHIFFINFKELDEKAQVKMYDRKRRLVAEGLEAREELRRVLDKEEYSWISPDMKNIFG